MKNFIVEDESEWKKVFSMSLIEQLKQGKKVDDLVGLMLHELEVDMEQQKQSMMLKVDEAIKSRKCLVDGFKK